LHQCIRPLVGAHFAPGHHGYQRAPDLLADRPHRAIWVTSFRMRREDRPPSLRSVPQSPPHHWTRARTIFASTDISRTLSDLSPPPFGASQERQPLPRCDRRHGEAHDGQHDRSVGLRSATRAKHTADYGALSLDEVLVTGIRPWIISCHVAEALSDTDMPSPICTPAKGAH
jgi:hypothetical protein